MEIKVDVKLADMKVFDKATEFGIFAASEQALKDCNYLCKQDTSTLINSSLIHSEPEKGILRWVTPYAEHQYTFPGTRHDKNPNACPEWAKRAAETKRDMWKKVFEKAVMNYGG
ncbi:MAG: hypothetical protein II695_06210 [Oscillospiraceae bacterium]|nr:hypothetical protein [Oscillospiraceae bacterium]